MLDRKGQAQPMASQDVPVNLPANRTDPEYLSDQMVDVLRGLGIDYVFLLPGSSYRGLHDSLVNYGRNQAPQMILATHEGAAVAMAHGYAKAMGYEKVGVSILHDLVGLMQGTMGMFNAFCDNAPMLVLGGSGPLDPRERRFIDWAHTANTQSDLVKDYVKWTDEPPTPSAILEGLARGHRVAGSRPWGPVYVSIDCLMQENPLDPATVVPDTGHPRYRPAPPIAPNPEALADAVELLVDAERPLVVGGRVGVLPQTTAPLAELVEALGTAYVDDRNFVCMPTDHPQNLSGDNKAMSEADVTLAVDLYDLSGALGLYSTGRSKVAAGGDAPKGSKIIDLSLNDFGRNSWANFGGPLHAVDIALYCDPLYGLVRLRDAVKARLEGDRTLAARAAERRAALASRHESLLARQREEAMAEWDAREPMKPERITHEVYQAIKDKNWVMTSRSLTGFSQAVWPFSGSGQYLGGSGGGGVGYSTPASVGAAIAARDQGRFCVGIVGDGDFIMYPGAVWTAVHYKVPLLLVIKNNTSWGNDEVHQNEVAHLRGRPQENAWIGQRMCAPDIDFATIARGCGAWAEGPVTAPDDLAAALKRAVAEVDRGGVAVIDARSRL